jgi:hypothetical protein
VAVIKIRQLQMNRNLNEHYVMKKPYDIHESVLLKDPNGKDAADVLNFYRITSELHAIAIAEYESSRVTIGKIAWCAQPTTC